MSSLDAKNKSAQVPTGNGSAPRFFRGSGTSQAAAMVSGVAALLLQQRPGLTPDQVKCLLKRTADPIRNVDVRLQGAGLLDVKEAIETKSPPSAWNCVQTHATSSGLGSLESARGGSHVADPLNGVELTGERDIFGSLWNGTTWSAAASANLAWSGGVWNGSTWSGSTWSGSTWSGSTWSGSTWSGSTWSGQTWSGSTWSGSTWSGSTWSGSTWSGSTWSGNTWSGHTWR